MRFKALGYKIAAASMALAVCASLSSCAAVVIGAGASAGTAAAEERGARGAFDDAKIRAQINDLWFQKDAEMFRRLSLLISEGRVMITGTLPSEDLRAEAVRLAWQAKGVSEVLNEIQVGSNPAIDYGRDVVIANTFRTKLLFDRQIANINYSFDVINGIVYIIGVAQNAEELDRVLGHARNIDHVKRVVHHVLLKDDPRRRSS